MTLPAKPTRRDFLTGQAAIEALGELAGPPPSPAEPSAARSGRSYLLSIAREAMACEFEVLLDAQKHPAGADAAIAALDLVERLEGQLTVYRETSEVAGINRRAAADAVVVEAQLFELLLRARTLYEQTRGAFDITAGPLSKVWGFYRRQGQMPSAGEVTAVLESIGSHRLRLDPEQRTVRFLRPGMELNLGAIGKGYAIDRAAQMLLDHGVADFTLHGGNSSVLACGHRHSDGNAPAGGGWTVALRHPLRPEVRLAEFQLVNQALGTSGSGSQFFHYQGKRYGHILDPRTGWPADKVLSATVIAPTAEQADALSTALYVLGIEGARTFCAAHPDTAALLILPAGKSGDTELVALNLAPGTWRRL